jgi:hypothetical protein
MPHCIPSVPKKIDTPLRFLTAPPTITLYIDGRKTGWSVGHPTLSPTQSIQQTHEGECRIVFTNNYLW